MASLPTIHLLHASDSHQHLTKLEEIPQRLKAEHRIASFSSLRIGSDIPSLSAIKGDDMALNLLTYELKAQKKEIERKLSMLKGKNPNLKIAEIILDHVPYGNEHITFPEDLKPISDRGNTDAIWRSIEQSLKEIFPAKKESQEPSWTKYLKYAIPVLVMLAFFLWRFLPDPPEVLIGFTVDKTQCDAPCEVNFTNTSENTETYEWNSDDGYTSNVANPSHEFTGAGDYTVTLIASGNGQKKEKTQRITVSEPCFDPDRVNPEGMCTMHYLPVCGCDGKTYSNACEAGNAGLISWEDGACE